jgi:D-alanyl-D-alanine carboxypeptidase
MTDVRAWVLVLGLLVGIGPVVTVADPRPNPDLEALSELLQRNVDEFQSRDGYPGCVAAVALQDGSVISAAAGMADPDISAPMTVEHRFMSGSIGKSFVAAVALALSLERRLDLDDPISTWLGDEPWFERLPNGPDITTRMLLRHASGLEDHVSTWEYALEAGWKYFVTDPDVTFSPQELIEIILDREPLFPPGKGYSYTDTGYILVGLIIEEVAGASYYAELQRRFLDPLDLDLTSPAIRRDLEGLAVGHTGPDDNMVAIAHLLMPEKTVIDGELVFDPNTEWTGGGLVTNPRDLVVWAKTLYEGRALRGSYTRELLTPGYVPMPRTPDEPPAYGLGVRMSMSALGPAYGHGGFFPGFNSAMSYFPEHGIAVAIQWNSDGIPGDTLRGHVVSIAEAMLAESVLR